MTLGMHETLHLLVALGPALATGRLGRRPSIAGWLLLSSIVIDIDHCIDYLRAIGPRWDLLALSTGSYFASSGQVIILLHSWELALSLTVLGLTTGGRWKNQLVGLGIGMVAHLLVDQFAYHQPWAAYFLAARWLHRFADPAKW